MMMMMRAEIFKETENKTEAERFAKAEAKDGHEDDGFKVVSPNEDEEVSLIKVK